MKLVYSAKPRQSVARPAVIDEWSRKSDHAALRLPAGRVIDYTELLWLRLNVYRAAEDFGRDVRAHFTDPGDEVLRGKARASGMNYGAAPGEMLTHLKSLAPTERVTKEIGYMQRRARLLSCEMVLIG